MTVLPKSAADWERLIPLIVVLVASGVAWGQLKSEVGDQAQAIEMKADKETVHEQYQAIRDALKDIQSRLAVMEAHR